MNNTQLIQTAKQATRNDTVLQKGIIDLLCDALVKSDEQVKQLAAENAKLADCANFYRLGFQPVKGAFGIEYRPTEQLLDDCGNTALEAIKTPVTDAYAASLRAEGVEMFAKKCSEKSKHAISSDTRDNWWLCGEHADDFAAQLRSQFEQVKGVQL